MGLISIVVMWLGFALLLVGIPCMFRFDAFLGVLIMLTGAYLHITGINKAYREALKR